MRKKVLIITNQLEQEVDGVVDFLREQDVIVKRWNLCQFPENEFYYTSQNCILFPKVEPNEVLDGGWLHQYGQFSIEKSLTGLKREVALKETNSFVHGIISSLNCGWVNHPAKVIHASNKVFQLHFAGRLNIPSPDYIISNDRKEIKKFVDSKKNVVIKSIAAGYISYGGQNLKIFTKKFSSLPEEYLQSLKYAPVIVQQFIEKKKEFRITVVDSQCFSVEVDYSSLPPVTDVRELIDENYRGYFKRAKDVEEIEKISIHLTRTLGLTYAGIDWLQSTDGKFYFLELNPLGSFKWYEQCGEFNITEAIGKTLL